jgi:hypothetical protein
MRVGGCSMQKFYVAANHNVIRLFEKEGIGFPITKKEMLDKVGSSKIQIDFDKWVSFDEFCENVKLDAFENKAQFFCALVGTNTCF